MLSLRPPVFRSSRNTDSQLANFVVGTTTVSNRFCCPNFGPWPTSKSSTGAFASGSPGGVSEFHLSPANTPDVELLPAARRLRTDPFLHLKRWGLGTASALQARNL